MRKNRWNSQVVVWLALWLSLAACAPSSPAATPVAPATGVATSAAVTTATAAPTSAPTVAPTAAPTAAPTLAPTTAPTAAPTAAATTSGVATRFAVQAPDKSVRIVDLNGKSTPLSKATVQFQPGRPWFVIGNTLYTVSIDGKVYAVDATSARQLTFIPNTSYGLAVNGSGTPLLAWGTAVFGTTTTAEIDVSTPTGGSKKPLVKESVSGEPRIYRVEKFSRDGKLLYFGKEPTGLGGYILFSGLTSLWSADVASGKTNALLNEKAAGGFICIDSLAPNEQLAATHCNRKGISVVDLRNASSTAQLITPPSSIDFLQLGSATFSPDSTRVAFAVARGNPDNEKGWVLVSDGLSGTAKVVALSADKEWYSVEAWPDANTILIQSNALGPNQAGAVYMVHADGSNLTKLADGTFLALLAGTR